MRDILFLSHRMPWPPDRGDKIRSYHLLRYLCEQARVHLVTFAEDMTEMASADALDLHVASAHVGWRSGVRGPSVIKAMLTHRPASVELFNDKTIHRQVARLLNQEDIGTIFAFSGQMAQYVPSQFDGRFLMDFVDVDSQKFAAYAKHGPLSLRWLYAREANLLERFERNVAKRADLSIFVSEAEASLFRRLSGLGSESVAVIENGIDFQTLDPESNFPPLGRDARGDGPLLVFTGQMDYLPNIDAVTSFAERVLPVLHKFRPNVQFAIVGRDPSPEVERLASLPGIIVTGSVPDVRPWIAAADLVVAPLSIARGVQNKILEAMAMARPVVASSAAAEGIDALSGRDFVIADDEAMTTVILDLLNHPIRAERIGRQARERVQARYRWEDRLKPLGEMIRR